MSLLRPILPFLPAGAILFFWLLSHLFSFTYANYYNRTERHWIQFASSNGQVFFARIRHLPPREDMLLGFRIQRVLSSTGPKAGHYLLGFQYYNRNNPDGYAIRIAGLPYWFLFLLSSPPLILFARRRLLERRRARRISRKLCPLCAYDLRATPTRCPECGYQPT